ncbi:hypothetical protein YB2330_000863 [Saitoella coloradoensis]
MHRRVRVGGTQLSVKKKRRNSNSSDEDSPADEAEARRQSQFRNAFAEQEQDARIINPMVSPQPDYIRRILQTQTPFKLRSQDVSTFDPADKSFRVMAFIAELRNLKNKYGEASIMDLFPKQLEVTLCREAEMTDDM